MKKNGFTRIVVPIIVVILIIMVWGFKNWQKSEQAASQETQAQMVSDKNFLLEAKSINLAELKEYKLPIIIDFGADSCIPCKEMAPVLQSLNEEMQGRAIIKFVDVWKNPDSVQDFPVQVIPTQIIINADGSPYTPSSAVKIPFMNYFSKETKEHLFTAHQGGLTMEELKTILADMGVQ